MYSSGGYVRYLGITDWVGMAESAARLTYVLKAWTAYSRSVAEDEGSGWGWRGQEWIGKGTNLRAYNYRTFLVLW